MTWKDALETCLHIKRDLISISSAMEDKSVEEMMVKNGDLKSIWIGLNDIKTEGNFEWTDGTKFNYANWDEGEPNNTSNTRQNCVQKPKWKGYRWVDTRCSNNRSFICTDRGNDT